MLISVVTHGLSTSKQLKGQPLKNYINEKSNDNDVAYPGVIAGSTTRF
jgi:hypothetical protein